MADSGNEAVYVPDEMLPSDEEVAAMEDRYSSEPVGMVANVGPKTTKGAKQGPKAAKTPASPQERTRQAARSKAKEETRARVRYTVLLIIEGHSRAYIMAFFRKNYSCKDKTTEKYIGRARQVLANEISQNSENLIAQSYAFYMKVCQDDKATTRDKLRARELADRLLGIQAPTKIAKTDAKGKDLKRAAVAGMTDDELRVLAKAGQRLQSHATNKTAPSAN